MQTLPIDESRQPKKKSALLRSIISQPSAAHGRRDCALRIISTGNRKREKAPKMDGFRVKISNFQRAKRNRQRRN